MKYNASSVKTSVKTVGAVISFFLGILIYVAIFPAFHFIKRIDESKNVRSKMITAVA